LGKQIRIKVLFSLEQPKDCQVERSKEAQN